MGPRYDCNCDAVIAMDEMGVGVQEILQYAAAILPRRAVRRLVSALEALLDEPRVEEVEEYATGDENGSPTELSGVAF